MKKRIKKKFAITRKIDRESKKNELPCTNSFGTDFAYNHLTEEEATEVLRQAYQTIAKKKMSKTNERN